MASTRTGIRRVAGLSALLAALLTAPAAQADEFCFPDLAVDASCDMAPGTFQQTLTAAQNMPGADSVLLGAGNFSIPKNQGYNDADPGNSVQIIGRGTGATTLTLNDTTMGATAMIFDASAGSTMRDLSFVIPANDNAQGDTGLTLGGSATTRNVSVTGPMATNVIGVRLQGAAVLDDSTIDLEVTNNPQNFAVRPSGSQNRITDSTLIADFGVSGLGTTDLIVERSTINASLGIEAQGDSIVARNSVIDLGSADGAIGLSAANFNESSSPMTITGDHLTIVGGGMQSIGARAIGDSNGNCGPPPPPGCTFGGDPENGVNDGETATINLSNSLISGPETAVFVAADRSEVANLTTSYSNYTALAIEDDDFTDGQSTGTATLTQTNRTTHAAPGFVSPTDFHLLPTSPLIDIGDPAAPALGATDIDGDARALDGSFNCAFVQRRDIGADEYAGATQGSTGCPTQTTSTPTENPECEPLRQKIRRLSRKIRQADDPVRKAKLKRKRRNARNRLSALGCSA